MYEPLKVSVIITVYNRAELLKKMLLSLQNQSFLPDEVIIADDGSQEDIVSAIQAMVRDASYPVKFISQPHRGYRLAKCRNNGARYATGNYLIFLDQDIVLNKTYVETVVKHRKERQFCVAYPVRLTLQQSQLVTDRVIESSDFQGIVTKAQMKKVKKQYLKESCYRLLKQMRLRRMGPKLRGGVAAINRDDFLAVNGYDENYQGWANEDDDFGRRLYCAGIGGKNPFYHEFPLHLYHEPFHQNGNRANLAYYQQQIKAINKGFCRCQFGFENPLGDEVLAVKNLN